MRSSQPRWWGYARAAIRDYPKLHEQLEALRLTSMTAAYTGMPHGSGVGDPVYQACSRSLPMDDQRAHDAVDSAIKWVMREKSSNAEIRMKLIRLVYWDKSMSLDAAADEVGYSYWHARRLNSEFIYRVGYYAGMTEKPEKMA